MDQGRWFAYGFPGWPSLLALGVVAGVPWLVNPLVSGICVLLAHHLLRRTHDRGIANATAALFAVSPWFLFMAGEFLSHQAATMWLLLALLGVQLARERSSARWGLVAGLALGALCLTRPLDGVIAGLVIAAWTLGLAGARRLALRPLLAGLLGVGAMGVAGLAYNRAITGDPLRTAHGMWMDRAWGAGTDRLGFGADRGNDAWPQVDPLPGHGLPDVVINANRNIFQLNVDLLGWGFGSLLIALVFLMSSGVQPRDRFLVLLVLATPLAYSTYWFGGGPDHGARYWYLTLVPLLVFTARGAEVMAARATPTSGGPVAPAMLALAAVVSLLAFMPWRATGKYPGYRGVTAEPARLALRHQVRDAVVFIRSPERAHYQSAFNLNPRQLSDPGTVYARYLDEASRGRVMAAFPGRASWVFSNDDTPGGGWSVAGPYPPGSVPP
jgi:4-amino-4-deoxy-L-arabinose transferase-like glycosyltransferase